MEVHVHIGACRYYMHVWILRMYLSTWIVQFYHAPGLCITWIDYQNSGATVSALNSECGIIYSVGVKILNSMLCNFVRLQWHRRTKLLMMNLTLPARGCRVGLSSSLSSESWFWYPLWWLLSWWSSFLRWRDPARSWIHPLSSSGTQVATNNAHIHLRLTNVFK